MTARTYSTRRHAIVTALKTLFAQINGTGSFRATLAAANIHTSMKFYEDIRDFPTVCVTASSENRVYQAGGYRDRYLDVRVILYLNMQDGALSACEALLEDIETLVESNGKLAYLDRAGATQYTHDILVIGITTDEGTLDPISIGEMTLRVHY